MEIYVVQQGDTINSIAERFGVSIEKLIIDNGLDNPDSLIVGQTIVIAYPKETYMVQQGDTLESIANTFHVSVMQLLRNNPFLSDREFIYPGELLVISYNTKRNIATFGFAFPFIKQDILIKTLPSLTYLAIFNYRVQENADIYTYVDDTEIINLTKVYGTVPILLLSILTLQGEPDVDIAYRILLNEELQEKVINTFVGIMITKGYGGINIVINLLNEDNQLLLRNYVRKISERLKQENLLFFITFNFKDYETYKNIDYSQFSMYADKIIFLQLKWGANYDPPGPVSEINDIETLINQVIANVAPEKIIVGKPTIGYDWPLPYVPDKTSAVSLSIHSVITLAFETNSTILFDEDSQTPYFMYYQTDIGFPTQHIVWFIDARSVNVLLELINEVGLYGSGIWNVMTYFPQLWLLINSQFDIIKII